MSVHPRGRSELRAIIIALAALPLLTGCISAVKTVVTAPVKAVGQVADWTTTSQDESDRNRGREMRKRERPSDHAPVTADLSFAG